MKKITILLLTYLLFAYSLLTSQIFQDGYLVTNAGDTLKGIVALDFDDEDQRVVLFKGLGESDITEYSSKEALAVGTNDYLYRSKSIRITEKRGIYPEKIVAFRSFVEVLIDGELVLYRFWFPSHRNVYFLQQGHGLLTELTSVGTIQVTREGNQYEKQDRRYINVLNRYLYHPSCPYLNSTLSESPYSEKIFLRLVRTWYDCTNNSPTYVINEKASRGMKLASFQATGSLYFFDKDPSRDRTYEQGPGIELGLEFRHKRYLLWKLHLGVEFLSFAPIAKNMTCMVPISLKRYQAIKKGPFKGGAFYGKLGLSPLITFSPSAFLDAITPRSSGVWLMAAGYEIASQSRHPIFVEWRNVVPIRNPRIPIRPFELSSLRAGIKF